MLRSPNLPLFMRNFSREDLLTLSEKESQQGASPNDLKRSERLLVPSGTIVASPRFDGMSQSSHGTSSVTGRRMRAGCSPTTHRQLVTLEALSEYCSSVRYLRSRNESSLYADDVGAVASGRFIRACLDGFRISRIWYFLLQTFFGESLCLVGNCDINCVIY